MTEKSSFLKTLMDHDSLLHKLATYGVFIVVLIIAILQGGGASPAWGWLVIAFLFYYAVISQRILETLILGGVIATALSYGTGFIGGIIDNYYMNMESEDFVWAILLCGLMNIVVVLLRRTGAMDSFGSIVEKHTKTKKGVNIWTWLMQFPIFFDDYMHMTIGGKVMAPIYDKMDVPREEGAWINHTLAEPLRIVFPITSWTAFMAGLYVSGGIEDGFGAFVQSIPFQFYAWISLIGTLLFALGVLPKLGGLKHPDKSLYLPLENEEDAAVPADRKKGTLIDFFIPIVLMIVLAYFFEWDLVPAMFIVLPVVYAYFMIRGIISSDDIEGTLVEGMADFMYIFILFACSYVLGGALTDLGYIDYLVEMAQQSLNPAMLPVILFVIFCISEGAMSLNWSLLLIAFPVIIPLAQGVGANVPLTAAAVISAGCFGCNWCYICDYTTMTAMAFGLPPAHHAKTCIAYSLVFAVITAILYAVFGFVLA